jgi:hypothetical protein
MKTPLIERLVGGLVWRAARVNVRSADAARNELATAALALSGQRLALVSLGQGDFVRNLLESPHGSSPHGRGRVRRDHRPYIPNP